MKKIALRVLEELREGPLRAGELAGRLEKSEGWISKVVDELEDENLVEKDGKVKLADTYEASLLVQLGETYDLAEILAGKRERILREFLAGPRTTEELESRGFPKSTVYDALRGLETKGVVEKTESGYRIVDQTLERFLEARDRPGNGIEYSTDGERVYAVRDPEGKEGRPTAFSAFGDHGVEYYPNREYLYIGDSKPGPEEVLIHSLLFAENKKQMSMCGVFHLANKGDLDTERLKDLSKKWGCGEEWTDLLAFLDQREVKNADRFLPWNEFVQMAGEYGVSPRRKHPEERLRKSLEELGSSLGEEADAYLIGGANLILRNIKDSTKDIDIVLEDRECFDKVTEALKDLGYREELDIGRAYEDLEPRGILEREGSPRWDIFVGQVAGSLVLTEGMLDRSELFMEEGGLRLHLLSSTDIFLFKAVTDREGDLEDAALLARREAIDWKGLFEELREQERLTGKYPSFAVLDTLDLLYERYDMEVPVRRRLASYCLKNALLLALDEPKTIKELRAELDFPEHQIYNKLGKLEEEGRIEVDRTGKLNEYSRID